MYMHLAPNRMSVPPPSASESPVERIRIREAAGVASIVLLMFALVTPAALRVILSSAGLLGLMGVRLAAADARWVGRGAAWSNANRQRPVS